jgi:CDGSH-type Zn-finger protein
MEKLDNMDDKPDYKHLFPIALEVEQGKRYIWCGCGKSQNPPLCDKEKGCDTSVEYLAELNEEVYFCNCKQTKNPPLCDGSHAKLLLEVVKNRQHK